MDTYDRYIQFRQNGEIKFVPFVEIPEKDSDIYVFYKRGKSRLDNLSYQYYGDPNYGWLIMQANPEYGSLEYDIPDNTRIRIPYPLVETINNYRDGVEEYREINE